MAITFVGTANNVATTGSAAWNGSANTPINIPLPTGLAANDCLIVTATYRSGNANHRAYIVETGGQDWHTAHHAPAGTLGVTVAGTVYNGTWSATANLVIQDLVGTTLPITIHSFAFRPTDANHTIIPDATVSRLLGSVPSGAGPFTNTFNNTPAINRTPINANNATWALIQFATTASIISVTGTSGTWASAFNSHINQAGNDIEGTLRHKIQTSTTATGNLTVTSSTDTNRPIVTIGTISEVLSSTLEPTGTSSRLFPGMGFAGQGAGVSGIYFGNQFPDVTSAKVEFDDVVPTEDLTVSIWAYFTALNNKDDHRLFVRHRTTSNNINADDFSWMLGLSSISADSKFRVRFNNTNDTLVCDTTLSTGQWYHLCATFDRSAGTAVAYVNGVSDGTLATFSTSAWNTTETHKVVVGNNATSDNGTHADVAVRGYVSQPVAWGAALSADEVASLTQGLSPLSIQAENLLFYVPDLGRNDVDVDIIGGKTATQVATIPSRFGPQIKRRTGAIYS